MSRARTSAGSTARHGDSGPARRSPLRDGEHTRQRRSRHGGGDPDRETVRTSGCRDPDLGDSKNVRRRRSRHGGGDLDLGDGEHSRHGGGDPGSEPVSTYGSRDPARRRRSRLGGITGDLLVQLDGRRGGDLLAQLDGRRGGDLLVQLDGRRGGDLRAQLDGRRGSGCTPHGGPTTRWRDLEQLRSPTTGTGPGRPSS